MPKVSVIIPVYNAEKYLHQCLDTVVQQTLRDIEIICVDDGSTDSSLKILDEYAMKDKRITIMKQPNLGAGAARNSGIDNANGEYLLFLDSDDFFDLSLCHKVYHLAKKTNADVALFGAYKYDQLTGTSSEMKWMVDKRYLPTQKPFRPRDNSNYIFQISTGVPWSKLFKREYILSEGLRFQNLNNANDLFFVFSAIVLAKEITYIETPFVYYRTGLPNNLQSKKNNHPCDFYKATCALKDILKEKGIYDLYEQSFINYAVSNGIWNFNTLTENALTLREKINIIRDLGGINHPRNYYIKNDNDWYSDLLKLLGHEPFDFIQLRKNYNTNPAPKVSIIIPVYNSKEFLHHALESAIKQVFCDIEIICVNDGSKDDSLSLLKEYALRDERITIISKPNGGLSSARNAGLNIATGEYVLFLDDDDKLDINAAADLYERADGDQLDIIVFNRDYFYENETVKVKNIHTTINTDPVFCYKVLTGPQNYELCRRKGPYYDTVWTKFYRLEFLDENNLRFIPGIIHEDAPFSFVAMLTAKHATRVPDKYYKYFIRNNSIMTIPKSTKNFEGYFIGYVYMLRFWLTHAFDAETARAIKGHLQNGILRDAENVYVQLPKEERKKIFKYNDDPYIDFLYEQFQKQLTGEQQSISAIENFNQINQRTGKQEIFLYRSYKIGCNITWLPRKLRGGIRCLKEHGWKYTWHRGLGHLGILTNIKGPRKTINKTFTSLINLKGFENGLNKEERSPRIIVSLTTFPDRIHIVHKTIITLLAQTVKPDVLVLWLAEDQFPDKEKVLPKELLELRKYGLTIEWCDDLKPHKKYFYTMQKYPDDIVITVDDDIYYSLDLIEILYKSYQHFPYAVSAMRAHKIGFQPDGSFMPYKGWKQEDNSFLNKPSMDAIATGVGGVLYPPHCLDDKVFDKECIKQYCINADDLWLKVMEVIKGTPTVLARTHKRLHYIENSQVVSLWHENINGGNDKSLKNIMDIYDKYYGKGVSLMNLITRNPYNCKEDVPQPFSNTIMK